MSRTPNALALRKAAALATAVALGLLIAVPVIAANHGVSIAGFAYSPASLAVAVGDSVTWTNADGVAHTVTADDASFNSGSVAGGDTFARTFSAPGTVSYHCAIHPTMTGTVVVEAAVVTAAPSVPPSVAPAVTPAPSVGRNPTPPNTATATATDGERAAGASVALIVALAALVGLLGIARRITLRTPPTP